MINLAMTVHYQDEREQQVVARPVTQVAFERKFSRGFASAFSDMETVQLEWVYFLAWHAARPGIEFDEWLESVAEIDLGVAAEVVPFDPATSAG
jgi:hypothetical protein